MVFDKDKARRMIDATMDRNADLSRQLEWASNDLTRLRAELEKANKKLRHYEDVVCLDDGLIAVHPDGCETKPISTVKLGALFAKLAAAEAARDEAVERFDAERVVHRQTLEAWKMLTEERDELTKALAEANDNRAKLLELQRGLHGTIVDLRRDLDEARRERDSYAAAERLWEETATDAEWIGRMRDKLLKADRDRDTHKARADAAEADLSDAYSYLERFESDDAPLGMPAIAEAVAARADAACELLRRAARHLHVYRLRDEITLFLASPGATTEAEQARGGECEDPSSVGYLDGYPTGDVLRRICEENRRAIDADSAQQEGGGA